MPQIIDITSEALQATIRRLLPSQQGFGQDLQASNVITPVIDLTPTAEGSQFPSYIQEALAYGSATTFAGSNVTTNLTSVPGFYRVTAGIVTEVSGSGRRGSFFMTDGSTSKDIVSFAAPSGATTGVFAQQIDLIFFVAVGITLGVFADPDVRIDGSFRQVATSSGVLVNPAGFSSE